MWSSHVSLTGSPRVAIVSRDDAYVDKFALLDLLRRLCGGHHFTHLTCPRSTFDLRRPHDAIADLE
jgi:hypothetical protein